jgi:hypothetical protein
MPSVESETREKKEKEKSPFLKWLGGASLAAGGGLTAGVHLGFPSSTVKNLTQFLSLPAAPSASTATDSVEANKSFLQEYARRGHQALKNTVMGVPVSDLIQLARKAGVSENRWTPEAKLHYAEFEKSPEAGYLHRLREGKADFDSGKLIASGVPGNRDDLSTKLLHDYRAKDVKDFSPEEIQRAADNSVDSSATYKRHINRAVAARNMLSNVGLGLAAVGASSLLLYWLLNRNRKKKESNA